MIVGFIVGLPYVLWQKRRIQRQATATVAVHLASRPQ
jgi:hypothetical protein